MLHASLRESAPAHPRRYRRASARTDATDEREAAPFFSNFGDLAPGARLFDGAKGFVGLPGAPAGASLSEIVVLFRFARLVIARLRMISRTPDGENSCTIESQAPINLTDQPCVSRRSPHTSRTAAQVAIERETSQLNSIGDHLKA